MFEGYESCNRWGYGATKLVAVEVKALKGREGPDPRKYGTRKLHFNPRQPRHPPSLPPSSVT